MSNYWKKKMDELEKSKSSSSSKKEGGYWQNKMDELEAEKKRKVDIAHSPKPTVKTTTKTEDDDIIAPIRPSLTIGSYIKENGEFDSKDYLSKWWGEVKEYATKGEDGYNLWDNFMGSKKGYEAMEKETAERLVSGEKVSFGESVNDMVGRGLSSFNQSITKTADVILGKPLQALGWENNPISKVADFYDTAYQAHTNRERVDAANKGKGWEIAGDIGSEAVAAMPNALLAMMTSGGSTATSTGLTTTAALETGNFATKAHIAAMRMAKDPQYWLSFARTYGNDYERGMELTGGNETLSYLGATLTSMLNAGVEIGIDGKSGIQGLPDAVANGGESALYSWLMSTGQEGAEEIIQGIISRTAEKHLYGADEVKVFDQEQMLREGAMGAAVGGLMGGAQIGADVALNATANAIDAAQAKKLTENEQKVVDKEVENRIAEQEKDGKKLTAKEKATIKQDVIRAMERGRISTETIEEVLGGDEYSAYKGEYDAFFGSETYKAYQDTIASEEAQIKEIEEQIKALENEPDTIGNRNKYNALESQIEEIKNSAKRAELKAQIDGEAARIGEKRNNLRTNVSELVKNDRLYESYNELIRQNQKFEADFEKVKGAKYEDAARKTLENAASLGIDNTNKSHDLVDFATKISGDTGEVVYLKTGKQIKAEFIETQSAKIAELEKIENPTPEQTKQLEAMRDILEKMQSGKTTIDGYIAKDGIVLNLDSDVALNRTVGHEVMHKLEKAKHSDAYRKALFSYAKTKGVDIDSAIAERKAMYAGISNAQAEAELVADMTGDYLFSDEDFVRHLSVTNRNVFQKIYDEIKYLYNLATAGSKEARELEKVKRTFEKIYREGGKAQTDTKYSLENGNKRDYNKRNRYSETETLFLSWENSSAPVGEVKRFIRFGKVRYYEKTENGCVELSKSQYNERRGKDSENAYRRAERRFGGAYDIDESTQRGMLGGSDGDRHAGRSPAVLGQALSEKLPDVTGRSTSGTLGYDSGNDISQSEYNEEASDEPGASFTFSNDYAAIRNHLKEGDTASEADIAPVKYSLSDSDGKQLSTANAKPTADADIRFSLSDPVEQTKDLVALHNLTADKLTKSLQLGGLPMPSLAVTKADIPHSNFGDITLIFGRETIDPKANRKNKVYSADAWTPVFPSVEYEADSEVSNRISQKLGELERKVDDSFQHDLRRLRHGHEDYLNRNGGEEGLIHRALDNYGLKAAYLEEQGKHIDKVTKQQEAAKPYNPDSAEKYQKIMDILGVTTADEIRGVNLKDAREQHGEELEAVYPGITSSAIRMGRIFGVVQSYIEGKDSGPVYNTVTDIAETQRAVDEALDAEGYEAWVRDLFSGIVKDSGIYNNKDLFTPSGNRRSFKQTHLPVTLENIVKAMAGQNNGNTKNVSGFNGVKTLRASTAETFKSVEQMHQKKDRLQNKTQEEVDAIHDSLQTRLFRLMEAIDTESGEIGDSNPYIRLDSIGEILSEIGESGKFGVADIQRVFQQYSRTIGDDTALEVKQLLYDVSQMPVNLFEAKPERVVGFDEAKVFVIPNNSDVKLKQELLNRGYSIAEYDPNIEGHRQQVVNQFEEYKFSLSNVGEQFAPRTSFDVFGKDVRLETPAAEDVAPVQNVAENTTVEQMFPDDLAPVEQELDRLIQEQEALEARLQEMVDSGDFSSEEWDSTNAKWSEVADRIAALEAEAQEADAGRVNSLDDADVPPVQEAPYGEKQTDYVHDPFEDRDYSDVGKRNVKAYMYENPEVKPFFQAEAEGMLGDLLSSIKGERLYNDEVYYATGGEKGWGGTKRHTTDDIAYLLDLGYTYAQIEKGLNAIIEDNGAENNAVSKRIEFALNDRLLNGYKDLEGRPIPPNEEYINLLHEKQITEYSKEAFDAFMANADSYAPPADDIGPVVKPAQTSNATEAYEAIGPKPAREPRMAKATPAEQARAQVLTEEPKVDKKNPKLWNLFKDNVVDKGTVFETLSLKTGNRELQGRWKAIGRAESSAQWFMEHGNAEASSLKSIRETVEQSGKTQQFSEYLYHKHNVDRMNLEERYDDVENKPVFGYGVTSDISKAEAAKLEQANPEFKQWADSVYSYMNTLREMLVDNGVISSETAKLWAEMYPHYVPIRRKGDEGLNINVALDTNRTGINAPVKRATGGNRDILPLFDTMALRTEQTFKAVAKNRFGVELKNMLRTTVENGAVSVDEAIDSVESELLQEGKDGRNPTFTVFENGERVTFEITEEMYDTMKPKSKMMSYTNNVLNKANNVRRGLLTEYNPAFMLTNPIKDTQDVLMNSQHPARTYANFPKAIAELVGKNGQYYQEYMEHGGEQNTYFDGETKTFAKEKSGLSKVIGFPLEKISQANNFIERIPRMAEYIASRKMGRSIDVSMLDAARVTTDFSAGGDLVKMLNRNGFTFLNASVQGAVQQVRNVREAKYQGAKGWAKLAAKVAVAGLSSMLLNHLLWDDDEDYEELSDYVKQNYYIVGKYGDGKFVRIPKGRAVAVIQNAFEQMENLITGNDEADLEAFAELVISNLAPNNPLENNLIAPIMQAVNNTTWYGDDLVPTRLQDLPAAEQYDETTDSLSKWLGEKLNISPYKINYVLDQYSGVLGDTFLPMMTTEAERGNAGLLGNLIAPISDKFTTDSALKNQNVSDFYTKKDELTVNANASGATDEDVLMSKYMNSVNADLAKLYAEKRKIQNSDLPNAEKYNAVRDIQRQIVELTKDALGSYEDITFEDDYREGGEYARMNGKLYKLNKDGEWTKLSGEQATKYDVTKAAGNASYATDGTNHYRWYVPGEDADKDATPGWRKVTDKELERQNEVTKGLGISPETYWNNREEYSYAYDNPESYAVAKAVGGYEAYRNYSGELYDIKADKDKYGKSISGSRKEKVLDYINNLDADYYTRIILWKSEYPSDDSYNYEIIDYLNGRDDISFDEEIAILRKLGFDVTDDGDIYW